MTINKWLSDSTTLLKDVGVKNSRLDCILILASTINKSKEWIIAHSDDKISESDLLNLNTKVTQRLKRIPVAYIINKREFYGRNFFINKNVLIPRPESEIVIDLLLELWSNRLNTVIDIGTGSGCLAITAKAELPQSTVIAIDNSDKALDVARKNALSLHKKIHFLKSNLLDFFMTNPVQLSNSAMIVNLPYVPTTLKVAQELSYEPAEALFSGSDGMNHYELFWKQIASLQNTPSTIICESLKSQHLHMVKLAQTSGFSLFKYKDLVQVFKK